MGNNNSQNLITKESILTALMILMEKKNFKEISITELTKKAGVSRMAFYRNYNNLEDIITDYLDEFFEASYKELVICEKNDNNEILIRFFSYFREHKKLIDNLIKANLANLIQERCTNIFYSLSKEVVCSNPHPEEVQRFIIEFVSGGLYKILIEWAKSGMKESDEKMGSIIHSLMTGSSVKTIISY